MTTPTLSDSVTVSREVLFQEVGGEAVLLDLASESYFGLDEVGTRIWHLLQQDGALQSVYERMLAEYEVAAGRLEDDLLKHVGELADAGLVTVGVDCAAAP